MRSLLLGMGLVAIGGLVACSVFTSSQRIEIEPFADGTVGLASDIRYDMQGIAIVRIRDHITGPAVVAAELKAREVRAAVRAMVEYSVGLSGTGSQDIEPAHRAKAYRELFLGLCSIPLERGWNGFREPESLRAVAKEASEQVRLLDAVRVGHPLITEFVRLAEDQLDGFEEAFNLAIREMLDGIQLEHAEHLGLQTSFRNNQLVWMQAAEVILRNRAGDMTALSDLPGDREDLRQFTSHAKLDAEDLVRLEQYVVEQLRFTDELLDHLQPSVALYYGQLSEVREVDSKIRDKMRRTRVVLLAWHRAHAELARGVTDPAKIDVAALAGSILSASSVP